MAMLESEPVKHRWASTRYEIGDEVTHKGTVWEIYRIDLVRDHHRHPKPMYGLRRKYRAVNLKSNPERYTFAWVPASKIKLSARAAEVQSRKRLEAALKRKSKAVA